MFTNWKNYYFKMGNLSLLQRDLPNPGMEPRSPTLQADSSPAEPPGKPHLITVYGSFNPCWIQFVSILLRTYASIFIRDIGL